MTNSESRGSGGRSGKIGKETTETLIWMTKTWRERGKKQMKIRRVEDLEDRGKIGDETTRCINLRKEKSCNMESRDGVDDTREER